MRRWTARFGWLSLLLSLAGCTNEDPCPLGHDPTIDVDRDTDGDGFLDCLDACPSAAPPSAADVAVVCTTAGVECGALAEPSCGGALDCGACDAPRVCGTGDQTGLCVRPWDEAFGPAPPAETRVAMFDAFWRDFRAQYGGFLASDADPDTLGFMLRAQVEAAESHGEMFRVMRSALSSFRDVHNLLWSTRVCTASERRLPVAYLGVSTIRLQQQLGACITPLGDDTALVYATSADNPLHLAPGDVIVAADGEPLAARAEQLLAMPLCGPQSTHPLADHLDRIGAVATNLHLWSTIGVRRIGSDRVETLSTTPLDDHPWQPEPFCTEQLLVEGIDRPFESLEGLESARTITWGRVPGTNVGFVYVYLWANDMEAQFDRAIEELWDTDGLVVDSRFDLGGNYFLSIPGFQRLFGEDITGWFSLAVRQPGSRDPTLHTVEAEPFEITVDPTTSYDHPIAVLQGPGSGSTGDIVPYYFARHPRSRRFGRPTAGSACNDPGNQTVWAPDPFVGDITYARTVCIGLDAEGRPFAEHAADPDETVWLTPDDAAIGHDTVLERALAWIAAENASP
ncbi:MAG: hypothetical protein KC619_19265 [Myxococcales bacterium]|nr:hypothetical protein [Myxococcales bacterium]